jgi:hypothetical protein
MSRVSINCDWASLPETRVLMISASLAISIEKDSHILGVYYAATPEDEEFFQCGA